MAKVIANALNRVMAYRPQPFDYLIGTAVIGLIGAVTVQALNASGKSQCQKEFNTAVGANTEWRARYSGFNVQTPEAKYSLIPGCSVTTETSQNGTKMEQTIKWDKGSNTLVLPRPLPATQ